MSEVEEDPKRVLLEFDYPASAVELLKTFREWVDQLTFNAYHAGYESDPSYHDKEESMKLGIDLLKRLHQRLYDEHFQLGFEDRKNGVPDDSADQY